MRRTTYSDLLSEAAFFFRPRLGFSAGVSSSTALASSEAVDFFRPRFGFSSPASVSCVVAALRPLLEGFSLASSTSSVLAPASADLRFLPFVFNPASFSAFSSVFSSAAAAALGGRPLLAAGLVGLDVSASSPSFSSAAGLARASFLAFFAAGASVSSLAFPLAAGRPRFFAFGLSFSASLSASFA